MGCGVWPKNKKRRSHLRRLSLHSQNPVSTHTLKTKPKSYSGPFSANEAAMLCNASPELSLLQPACFGLSASSSILFPGLSLAWRCSGLNSGSRFMVILFFLVPRGCSVSFSRTTWSTLWMRFLHHLTLVGGPLAGALVSSTPPSPHPPLQLFSEPLWLSTALPSSLSWIESLLRLYWLFFLIFGGGFSSTVLFSNVCFLAFILLIIH